MSGLQLKVVSPEEAHSWIEGLSDVLIACVDGGASVSFMAPLAQEVARGFWSDVARGVAKKDRLLIVALAEGCVAGTVQVVFATPENQPHRADISKMLVHPKFRKQGLGAELLKFAERSALEVGRRVLVLDTAKDGSGERLYTRLGWVRVGEIPYFALMPDGEPCTTVYFYKHLEANSD